MKTLIIASHPDVSMKKCIDFLNNFGCEVICYQWPLKAIDNIDEVHPHLIVINADDFPRLWKVVVQFISNDQSFSSTSTILFAEKPLIDEEAKKAEFLKIKHIFSTNFSDEEKKSFYNTLSLQGFIQEKITQKLIFKHPSSYKEITGSILCMYSSVIIFHPDTPLETENIKPGIIIKNCTLQIGQAVIEPLLKVIKNYKTEIQFHIL